MTTSCRPQDPRTRRPKGPPVVDVAILRGGTRVDVGRCLFTPSPFDSGDSSAGQALDQRTLVLCDGLSSDEPAVLRVEELAAAGAPLALAV